MPTNLLRHTPATSSSTPDEVSAGINTVPASDGDYTGNYDHIRRCCLLLEKAAGYANQAEIAQSVGEALLLPVHGVISISCQEFGNIIIVNHSLDTDDPLLFYSQRKRPLSEVVDFIIR